MARERAESDKVKRRYKKRHSSEVFFILKEIRKKMLTGVSSNEISDAFNPSIDTVDTNTGHRYKDDIFKLELEKDRISLVANVNVQKGRMLRIMRDCTTLAEDQNIPAKDRIAAERLRIDIIIKILQLQ